MNTFTRILAAALVALISVGLSSLALAQPADDCYPVPVDGCPSPDEGVAEEPDEGVAEEPEPDATVTEEPEPDATMTEEPEPDATMTEEPEPDATVTEEPDAGVAEEPEPAESTPEPGEHGDIGGAAEVFPQSEPPSVLAQTGMPAAVLFVVMGLTLASGVALLVMTRRRAS